MNQVSDRYDRLASAFAAKVAAVPADAWSNQSPCADWDARGVVGHVIETQGMFLGFIGRELGDIPSVQDDPAAAWDAARATVLSCLKDPATAQQEFDGLLGRTTFESAVDRFLSFDLVIHAWDLARAAGLEHRMDPDDVTRVRAMAEEFGDGIRSPMVCGPALDPPPGADAQAELLAYLGRQA
jgi:uncharacterized protein (TIGR03086 family)